MERLLNRKNKQLWYFATIGATATAISFILLNILSIFGINPIIANTISCAISMVFSFVFNKKLTFQSKSSRYVRDVVLFVLFTLFGLLVLQNLVMIWLLAALPETWSEFIRLNVAKIVATGVSMTWNYLSYSRIVFKDSTKPSHDTIKKHEKTQKDS
jgi:putative flippase GtrA